ncbi:MAG: HD domain-containing protein [Blastocatellia bacterium]|nr:HD domain-containing protein [Blastocatellia bacterium]
MNIVDDIIELFRQRGSEEYDGEPVSQLEHALQTAFQAEQESADETLIAAALLHDIGQLLQKMTEDMAERGIDAWHEQVGAMWLARYFPPEVTEPVRLHVAAKRYLCTIDGEYRGMLSATSARSLALQGGTMNYKEMREFEASPFAQQCVRLRRWDDLAKKADLHVPGLPHYRTLLENLSCEDFSF